ncbi:MAG: GNAT family N-acetyltransferase [Sphingobacteriaceae bacterium]|nr:MAG: GNAT family N-acetyltransferase [Sphingobacteriaceae bacterium]
MDNITIKEIPAEEIKTYKAFFSKALTDDEDNFRLSPDDDNDAPFPTRGAADSFTIGVYVNETLAGVASFEREGNTREKLRHKGLLFRMYILPDYRGKGLAKKLISDIVHRAMQLGNIEQINLTVIANNIKAIKLYEQFGFRTFSSEERAIKWKGKYFTENRLALKLSSGNVKSEPLNPALFVTPWIIT